MAEDDNLYNEQGDDNSKKVFVPHSAADHTVRVIYRIELDWISVPLAIAITAYILKAILR